MIKFRERRFDELDITPDVLSHLREDGQTPRIIKESEASSVAKESSRSMVLYKAIQNKDGRYEIHLMDKEMYRFTGKLITERLMLNLVSRDDASNTWVAEDKYKGKVLNAIDIIGRMYKLSVVVR